MFVTCPVSRFLLYISKLVVVLVGGWILFICIVRFFSLQFAGGICNLSIDSTLDAMRQRWDPNKYLFLDFFPLKRSERTRLTTCVYSFFWAGNGFRMVVHFFRVRVSVLCTRTPWEGKKGAREWRVDHGSCPLINGSKKSYLDYIATALFLPVNQSDVCSHPRVVPWTTTHTPFLKQIRKKSPRRNRHLYVKRSFCVRKRIEWSRTEVIIFA